MRMGMVEKLEEEGLGVKEGVYWCGALLYARVTGQVSRKNAEDASHDETVSSAVMQAK